MYHMYYDSVQVSQISYKKCHAEHVKRYVAHKDSVVQQFKWYMSLEKLGSYLSLCHGSSSRKDYKRKYRLPFSFIHNLMEDRY